MGTEKENVITSKRLLEIRKERGLTQKDIADMCRMAVSTVCRWETGSISSMRWIHIRMIAEKTGVNEQWLMGLDCKKYKNDAETSRKLEELTSVAKDLTPEQIGKVITFIKEFVL